MEFNLMSTFEAGKIHLKSIESQLKETTSEKPWQECEDVHCYSFNPSHGASRKRRKKLSIRLCSNKKKIFPSFLCYRIRAQISLRKKFLLPSNLIKNFSARPIIHGGALFNYLVAPFNSSDIIIRAHGGVTNA